MKERKPEGAPRGSRHVEVRQVRGATLVAKANSNHWVVMDGRPESGGSAAGTSPKELLLMALGGCTAMDVLGMLGKARAPLDHLEVHVTAEEREEHPRIFTAIHVEYVFRGEGLRERDLERAIELSTTRYCSVSAMLARAATLTHSYRVEPPASPAPGAGEGAD